MTKQPQLLILPFDHRSSFSRDLLGYEGKLTPKQKNDVKALKRIVFDAFESVVNKDRSRGEFGILLDEEFGSELLRKAKKMGVQLCLTTEKSGQKEFQFEYGASFAKHINAFSPQYVKALVRYHPANVEANKHQLTRLKKLSDFCHRNGYQLLFELLVPPTEQDLAKVKTQAAYDKKLRAKYTEQAIQEIQKKVDVDLWKVEGFTKGEWKRILKITNPASRMIVLGRGGDRKQVETWLKDAAGFEQIIGFAVGRTIFYEPLKGFIAKKLSRTQAVEGIAKRFSSFVRLWRSKKSA
ncbi:MAG: DUF2090 domain-containing protein [Patescibacteria group bacterium]|jgi:5-dehydro-2-deoxygluconokinase